MGLIRAAGGAIGGTLADQWIDFFYAEAMPNNVLVTRGQRQRTGRGANTRGNENIISNGSGIAVADGQCMIIVEQGRIMDFCAEPGEYTWNQSSEPSLFTGDLGQNITNTFKVMYDRFTRGGDTGKDQRVYYFNIRELTGNKFGTATPIPFRVVDANIGLDIDITLRANGVYSLKISDPLLFYANVSGNVEHQFTTEQIDAQLKSEFLSALKPAFGRLSAMGMRYSAIPGHTTELCQALNEALSEKWGNLRGMHVISVAINSLSAPKEDEDMIKQLQRKAVMRDPGMAGAAIVSAQAEAMKGAAANPGGAMMGFMGLNMAQQAGGMNAQDLLMAGQQQRESVAQQQPAAPAPAPGSWSCTCGATSTGRFCQECGTPKPEPAPGWTCACGTPNTGRFCQDCGTPRPENSGWTCNCGAQNTGRFCQECGTPNK
ncbi:MAG: SPFH domain-containing protein [Clostridiales bacterium]|jgi:membrane protease subunit (stomatin/prohibitin family)|nr:SPFH domain-containing protein [Clostridiales bacterium]